MRNSLPAQFDLDLFAYHGRPLAFFLDGDGFLAVEEMDRPNIHSYARLIPHTNALAEKLLKVVPQRDVWGKQLLSGQWTTETRGQPVPCGKYPSGDLRTRPGKGLRVQDLIKHFAGRTFALGTVDLPRGERLWNPERGEWGTAYNKVRYLRVDVDQDAPWWDQQPEPILQELREERDIALNLGLPYEAFRTGNRGVQAVLALPYNMSHRLASYLLGCYLWLLEERPARIANVDVDNLHKLTRLPGGKHARTGAMGLWVDIDAGSLYPLDEQIRLMADGFRYPDPPHPRCWRRDAFRQAATDLIQHLDEVGIAAEAILSREQIMDVHEALPGNGLVERFKHARSALGVRNAYREERPIPSCTEHALQPEEAGELRPADPAIASSAAHQSSDESADLGAVQSSSSKPARYTREWADEVWSEAFEPGEFWTWINMGGRKGILAATIRFGPDQAVSALEGLAHKVPVRSNWDLQARLWTIRNLWKSFRLKDFTAFEQRVSRSPLLVEGASSEEIADLSQVIVSQMVARHQGRKWDVVVALHTVEVLLIALRESEHGFVEISYRALAASINNRWPDAPTNHMRVKETLKRLAPGKECLFELLTVTPGVAWRREPNLYQVGKDLLYTALGQACEVRRVAYLASQVEEEDEEDEG